MSSQGIPLGDRMKLYESSYAYTLTPRSPMILRIDGRSFHTWTRGMDKPWDERMFDWMTMAASALVRQISGARVAYVQSDEISVLVVDYDSLGTQPWFGKNLQKVVSVSSSISTAALCGCGSSPATFDSRAFIVPKEEVCNYFIWRQQDATRNSISGLAQSCFSHKSLNGVSSPEMIERLFIEKGINWNDCPTRWKRGWCVTRNGVDSEIPVFTQEREYIERLVSPMESKDG
jgi:tRNA(His) guanylyltransferase